MSEAKRSLGTAVGPKFKCLPFDSFLFLFHFLKYTHTSLNQLVRKACSSDYVVEAAIPPVKLCDSTIHQDRQGKFPESHQGQGSILCLIINF